MNLLEGKICICQKKCKEFFFLRSLLKCFFIDFFFAFYYMKRLGIILCHMLRQPSHIVCQLNSIEREKKVKIDMLFMFPIIHYETKRNLNNNRQATNKKLVTQNGKKEPNFYDKHTQTHTILSLIK